MASDTNPEMLTKSALKQRGWTDKLIRQFASLPNDTRRNPCNLGGPPMRLYDLERIEKIEATDEFKAAAAGIAKRRIASLRVVAQKQEAARDWANSLPAPNLPDLACEELLRRATAHYNRLWNVRGDFEKVASSSDSTDFSARITVNFVRHQLTKYESRLERTFRMVGKREATGLIRNATLAAIAKAYPWLNDECARQTTHE